MGGYLEKYGEDVLAHGYEIVPIKPGTKRPPFKNWEDTRATPKHLARWLDHGRGDHGVGILARKSPLVDIDCHDKSIVDQMVKFTQALLGKTLQRVGLAPKTGLLYRTDKPFPKVNSKSFVDPDSKDAKPTVHKLEVLGDGQQFVALAIHPDTQKPYRWHDKRSPHNVEWDDLPEITRQDAIDIAEHFEKLMFDAGYVEKRGSRTLANRDDEGEDDDNEFGVTDVRPVDITTQELSLKLQLVPGAEDYDTWRDVGMALYHQYQGGNDGLILWHEWSVQAHNYDMAVLDEKWPTFNIEGKGRSPVTARFILKLANEEERRVAGEQVDETKAEIKAAKTLEALRDAAEKVKHIPFEPLIRESIVNLVRRQHKEISGDALSTTMARQLVRYENPENKRQPKWLEGFVYVESDKVFYHVESRIELDAESFNAKHNRFMMTQKDRLEGRSAPEHTASQAALNLWEIETAYRRMYMPHEELFFTYNQQRFVNFYSDAGVPDELDRLSGDDKAAIRTVKAHLEHLFSSERDRKLLLDWMAYTVQERKRVSWAPVIQGTEGDGKSFFYEMLAVVLGFDNVNLITGTQLEEQYNAWLEGCLVLFIEEVRLHGPKRYEAVNRMKPWITNRIVTIRAHHRGAFPIVNTANIIMTTNHKDGIPAGGNDTRYFPMFSRFQTKSAIDAFKAANPHYYDELYSALEHAAALRTWLLDYKISKEFSAEGRAPESSSRAEMMTLNASDEEEAFAAALAEGRRDFCPTILDSALLDDMLQKYEGEAPYGRARKRFLSEAGFTPFEKKVKHDGKTKNLWTRTPEAFKDSRGNQNNQAITKWLESGKLPKSAAVNDDDPDDI